MSKSELQHKGRVNNVAATDRFHYGGCFDGEVEPWECT